MKSLADILLANALFAFVPLIILLQVAQLGPDWKLIRFTLLGISFACYTARIGLTQYRQHRDQETVRRQTLAMDSSVDGIAILNEKGLHIYGNSAFAHTCWVSMVLSKLWGSPGGSSTRYKTWTDSSRRFAVPCPELASGLHP